ncbi:hypothetical protein JE959_001750 [Aeromonas veronii]|nr:hypothetical protein [Aeromonas veronii]
MIFITDVKGDEPVILTAELAKEPLTITTLTTLEDKTHIIATYPAPPEGWTHERLCALDIDCGEYGAGDAYLGSQWVGSTEV